MKINEHLLIFVAGFVATVTVCGKLPDDWCKLLRYERIQSQWVNFTDRYTLIEVNILHDIDHQSIDRSNFNKKQELS